MSGLVKGVLLLVVGAAVLGSAVVVLDRRSPRSRSRRPRASRPSAQSSDPRPASRQAGHAAPPRAASGDDLSRRVPPRRRHPWRFFALVFALSVPFFVAGALIDFEVLPGLPVSSFAWVVPLVAAALLVRAEGGAGSVRALLGRALDFDRIRPRYWYLPIVLIQPGVAVTSYALMRLAGTPVPPPQATVATVLALSAAFLVAGLAEELGWSGYATEPLQDRLGPLGAALTIGVVWAVWHAVPLVQAHRAADWIGWWALGTIAQRVLIVWLFDSTGHSVFAAAVFHALGNVAWQLFPVGGSYFDPRLNALVLSLLAAAAAAVGMPRPFAGERGSAGPLRGRDVTARRPGV